MKNFLRFVRFNAKNFALVAFLLVICEPSFAANASKTSLPFQGALTTIENALTGPVARTIAIIGIVASGAALIWGGEISGFLKSVIYLVLVVSLIMCAGNFLTLIAPDGASVAADALASAAKLPVA